MPIARKPIVHKFGIISHSQRLQLQERLLEQSYLTAVSERHTLDIRRNPVEISEQFVTHYNGAKSADERAKLDVQARKILERIKRKAGVKDGGQGSHVDLPIAWTDLAMLAQCKGTIQEDCLDVFISSLEQGPLSTQHLPALFYLAETALYWLRTDAVKHPYLRSAEIKILRMGELVFLQLFYHHMAGHLEKYSDAKRRLFTYLNGLQDCQEVYNPYPNALFSLRYMNEVGKIIVSDVVMEPVLTTQPIDASFPGPNDSQQQSVHSAPPPEYTETLDDTLVQDTETKPDTHLETLSRSVHDLSPTLWHSLDIWRCTNHLSGGLNDALMALSVCGKNLNKENWIDGVLALKVLAEAAKTDITVLKSLQNLAQGVQPKYQGKKKSSAANSEQNVSLKSSGSELELSSPEDEKTPATLSDIQERSESKSSSDFDSVSSPDSRPTNPISLKSKEQSHDQPPSSSTSATQNEVRDIQSGTSSRRKADQSESSEKSDQMEEKALRKSDDTKTDQSEEIESTNQLSPKDHVIEDEGGFVGPHMCANAWAELTSDRAESPASSVETYTNKVCDVSGLHGWHWEVAITYTNLLTDLVLHGATSQIHKRSLIGSIPDLLRVSTNQRPPMKSAGLVDLVYFKAQKEASDSDGVEVIGPLESVSMLYIDRCLAGNVAREGTRTAAWTILSQVRTKETDPRVLEALKVGQVEVNAEVSLAESRPNTVNSQISARLAAIYLPPLPPVVAPYTPRKSTPRKQPPTYKRDTKPQRTSLKDEVLLATAFDKKVADFKTRADFDLRRVIEDQWRKELQQTQLAEEEQRRKEWQEEQENLEQEHTNTHMTKELKLAGNKKPIRSK